MVRKKKKKPKQNILVIWFEGKLPLWCVGFFWVFLNVGIQAPTADMWNHSPWAVHLWTFLFQEPHTCILWVCELMGWQHSCFAEDTVIQGRLSLFPVICLSRHSLLQNSFILSSRIAFGEEASVWCAAVSLCLGRNLRIHWDGNDHSQRKYCIVSWRWCCNKKMRMPWLRGRRTRGMEWEMQVVSLRSPFQEWQILVSLPTSLIKTWQWGWSLWHQSLHTLVVLLNYSFLFLW